MIDVICVKWDGGVVLELVLWWMVDVYMCGYVFDV